MKTFSMLITALVLLLCCDPFQTKKSASASPIEAQPAMARPSARTGHALVYAEHLRKVILLDGYQQPYQPELGEVWGWDGKQWELFPGSGPAARGGSAAAYDARRKKIVFYGGFKGKPLDDTWEWDGKTWRQMTDASVGTRDHHVMAYDAARGKTVMFGGVMANRALATDTWEWDGMRWHQAATQGPESRTHFAMVYDSRRKQIVLFGGDGEAGKTFNDTWTWDGKVWRKVSEAGPPARSRHRMAFDSRSGLVILYGGQAAKLTPQSLADCLEDTWVWNGKQWTEIKVPGPSKRYMPAMAYDAARGKTILYGGSIYRKGEGVRTFDDIWEWDGKQWAQIK